MQKHFDTVLAPENRGGNLRPVSGASVTVTDPNGNVATIYSDNGVTEAANPLTTSATGYYEFYAADGRYTLTIAKSGRDTVTIPDILLEDPADSPAPTTADMVSTADNKGAGLVGFSALAEYAAGTVGKWLKDLATSAGAGNVGFGDADAYADDTVGATLAQAVRDVAPLKQAATAYGLSKWRKALAKVRSGGGRAKLALIGDSTTMGAGSTGASTNNAIVKSYPTQLAALLNSYHVGALASSSWGIALLPATDPRVVYGTGWVQATAVASLGGPMASCPNTATTALAFTPADQWDTCDIYYAKNSGLGTFTVNVDGGATLATVNANATSGFAKETISTTLGSHTVNIARNGTGGTIYIAGIHCYNSAENVVDVFNLGWYGSKVSQWHVTTNGWSTGNALPILAPDLSVICLTINDWNAATDTSAYTASMQALIDVAKTTGDVILMTGVPSSTSSASVEQQATYNAICASLAASNDIQIIDLTERWGSYVESNALGYYADGLHPLAIGYADIAAVVSAKIGTP